MQFAGESGSTPRTRGPLKLRAEVERWPLRSPFRITGYTWDFIEVLTVRIELNGAQGRGEAAGVYYRNDRPVGMLEKLESLRRTIEAGVDRETLRTLVPRGGLRNALDCALWDLEAKLSGLPAWKLAGLSQLRPLVTTFTCGADEPERMAAAARAYHHARALKLKLTGEPEDAERVRAVREARPDVWLGVDANQGFSRNSLERVLPTLVEARVELIEQPLPIGQEAQLEGFRSPIPIAADESVQSLEDIPPLVGRFHVVNIKLDKCGGLTEGLAMARAARELGLAPMVGNMLGTSLAMAPAFLLGQLCHIVDLDGPLFLTTDRAVTVDYRDGLISCPKEIWG